MVELKGSLGSLGLPAVVQLICELHHSGNLELTRNGSRAVLGFDDGRLVAANYNDDTQGLIALAACTLELVDGHFVFVEGLPAGERTLDLSAAELQKVLYRLERGELTANAVEVGPAPAEAFEAGAICPQLGFVDDATRRYSRPTALHRCFASGAPTLVTAEEQLELCLSGRYATCPRFRIATSANHAESPRPAVARGVVPAVVGTPMQVASAPAAAAKTGPLEPARDARSKAQRPARGARLGVRPERRPLLLAIGAGLGLIVLVGFVLLVVAMLGGGFGQNPASSAVGSAAPTPAPAATAVTAPQSAAATAPSAPATALPAPQPTATPVTSAPARAAPGETLADARFASGPKPGWPENPPYATWTDGAYRLQARQPTHFVAVGIPVERLGTDVLVSATFRKTGGPPGGGYGLVVRDQSPEPLDGMNQNFRAYVMEVGDLGEFGIWRREGDQWVDLVSWTHSDNVRTGGTPNDLQVRALGNRLTFSANGVQLAAVQDGTLPTGGVGVFTGGDYNEVALDRFVVLVPD